MTNAEVNAAIERAKAGDIASRDAVIVAFRPYVEQIAGKVARKINFHVAADELAAAGILALFRLVEMFDPDEGISFRQYAGFRIRGQMVDFLRSNDTMSRLYRDRSTKLYRAKERFVVENGRPPSEEELQQAMGLSDSRFAMHVKAQQVADVSLDAICFDNDSRSKSYGDSLADPDVSAAAGIEGRDLMRFVLDRFGLRAALMLKLRYFENWTHKQIGTAVTDLSVSAVGERRSRSRSGPLCESRMTQAINRLLDNIRQELEAA